LSTDNGASWSPKYNGSNYVISLAISGANIFVGTENGDVYLSTNNGTSWNSVSNGLPNTPINSLAISGTNIFAGTWGAGIWRRSISEMTVINELNNSLNISIYPNPTSDNITIETPQKSEIEILNIQGQSIKSFTAISNKTTIDVSGFAKGLYILKVKTEKGIAVNKFVKE
jgi:hypothetical protein